MSWLDALINGVKSIAQGGVGVPLPPNAPPAPLNFVSGASAAYNTATGQYDVTITASGVTGQNPATLVNGLNSNIATGGQPTVRLAGPSAAFSVGGFQLPGAATPQAGQGLAVTYTGTQQLTVVNEDAGSASVARIATPGGTSYVVPTGARFTLTFDPSLMSSTGRWVLGQVSNRPRVLDMRDFGAVGDGNPANAVANYNKLTAAIAAQAAAGGGIIEFPPTGAAYCVHGAVAVPSSVIIRGQQSQDQNSTFGSVVSFIGAGSGFVLASTCEQTDFEDLLLLTDSLAGPAIGCVNGATLVSLAFRRLKFNLGNPATGAISFGSVANPVAAAIALSFDSVNITAAAGQSVPVVGIWATNGALNNITWRGKSWLVAPSLASTGTALAGTVTLTNGSAALTFSQVQTLPAGQLLWFSDDLDEVYELKYAMAASTSGTLDRVYTAAGGAGKTTTMVAEMVHIEAVDDGPVTNVDIQGIIFEQPFAGAIKWRGVRNSKIDNCYMSDMILQGQCINDLIWIGPSLAPDSPPAINIDIDHCIADVGQQDAASLYTGASASTETVRVRHSVLPYVQNVPKGGPYAANAGYPGIAYEGIGPIGYTGDQPTGDYQNVYSLRWARATSPSPLTLQVTAGLNKNVTADRGMAGAVRIVGDTGDFSIDGIEALLIGGPYVGFVQDGIEIDFYYAGSHKLTLIDKASSASAAGNKISLGGSGEGGSITLQGPCAFRVRYDLTLGWWVLCSTNPDVSDAVAGNRQQGNTANASPANPVLSPTLSFTCLGTAKKVRVDVSAYPINASATAAVVATMTLLIDGSAVVGAPTPSGAAVNATPIGTAWADTLQLGWDVTFPDNNAHTIGVKVASSVVLSLGAGSIRAQELV